MVDINNKNLWQLCTVIQKREQESQLNGNNFATNQIYYKYLKGKKKPVLVGGMNLLRKFNFKRFKASGFLNHNFLFI